MKPLLILLLLAFIFPAHAQHLSSGTRHSAMKYVYPLAEKDARVLYKKGIHHLKESMLSEPADSFLFEQQYAFHLMKPGAYIIAYAEGENLVTEMVQHSFLHPMFVQQGKKSILFLSDAEGNSLKSATVKKDNQEIRYDPEQKGYTLGRVGKKQFLELKHEQQTYFYQAGISSRTKTWRPAVLRKIRGLFERRHYYHNYFSNHSKHERKHRGYMLFSKPEYRPGDTLRFKAFVTSRKGKPINGPLLVRMTDRYFDTDSILGMIQPYRKGAYTFEMAIPPADKLPFDLDEQYLITLEHPKSRKYDLQNYEGNLDEDDYALKRKIVFREKFRLEEYTLNTFSFKARSSAQSHYYKEPVSVFLKATDDNDLPVQDGKVEITVVPEAAYAWRAEGVFVKDEFWKHTLPLETIGETKLTLPDSIFPAASFPYRVRCDFTSSDNELHTQTLYLEHKYFRDAVKFSMEADSLYITPDTSFNTPAPVTLSRFRQNKLQSAINVQLPYRLRPDDLADEYVVTHASKEYRFKVTALVPQTAFSRTADSVFALVSLPGKHPFWYSVFRGKKLLQHGYGDTLWLARKERTDQLYKIQVQYIMQGRVQSRIFSIPLYRKSLVVKADHPAVASPGEKIEFTISVTDVSGAPVPDADVTASSVTSKFEDLPALSVPYFGRLFRLPKQPVAPHIIEAKTYERIDTINWERWSLEMKLDTIGYYNFLHSKKIWETAEPSPDATTQIAPFVVEDGKFVPIELIYIDEVPVYFSKATNLNGYAFPVSAGMHHLRIRTMDRLISLEKIWVKGGHKTFIGINTALRDPRLTITRQKPVLSNMEKYNLTRYMILLDQNVSGTLAYVRTHNNIHLLNMGTNFHQYAHSFLVGPLPGKFAHLVVKGAVDQQFEPEGGYRFQISQGLIKQKRDSDQPLFSTKLYSSAPRSAFSDFVLNEAMLDSLWNIYLDAKSSTTTFQKPQDIERKHLGRLTVHLNCRIPVLVKNILLFKEEDPSFIKIFPAAQTDFGLQDTGRYKIYYLFMNGSYVFNGGIQVRNGGRSYYELSPDRILSPDKESTAISAMLREKISHPARWNNEAYYDLSDVRDKANLTVVDVSTFTTTIHGQVLDRKTLQPIVGALVLVKGTSHGAPTSTDGSFSLNVPENGVVIASSVGYEAVEKRVGQGEYIFTLRPASLELSEVVVVGYGAQRKAALTGAVAVVTNQLMGSLPGVAVGGSESIRIRGLSTLNAKPLIIVDGVPYNGDLSGLDSAYLKNMRVLKADVAVGIYGAMAANGVIILSRGVEDKDAGSYENAQDVSASLRKNFRDDAFWLPKLKTDKEGKAVFSTVLPDDITSWKNRFIVAGSLKRTGSAETTIRSFKALSAQLSVPAFLVEGDSVQVLGKTMNYGHDTLLVRNTFFRNGVDVWAMERTISSSKIDSMQFRVSEKDSVRLKYLLQRKDGYFDGEERNIPVFPQGVLETKGIFAALSNDTSLTVDLKGPFLLHAETSGLPAMLEEINHLKAYKYLCNEQLASKLKALLLEKEVRTLLKQDFKENNLVKNYIEKLNRSKGKSGLWGWWSGNDDELWISLHVSEALLMAEKHGFRTDLNKEQLKNYLIAKLEKQETGELTRALRMLRKLEAKVDFERYIEGDSSYVRRNRADGVWKLRRMEAWQEAGKSINADSLLATRSETVFGNYYWGKDSVSLWWNSVQATLSAYRLLRGAGQPDAVLEKIRYFFLEKRRSGNWENTYESIEILSTILPDMLKAKDQYEKTSIQLAGGIQQEISAFPFTDTISANGVVTVTKKGPAPVYFTAYNKTWNPAPEKVSGLFTVNTSFSGMGEGAVLSAGKKVQLNVSVTAKKDAEYVLLEVPVPAGCSFGYKAQAYGRNWEVHREYFKEKVSIFCRQLPKGVHSFSIELVPRFNGRYKLNPAKAEMMYFPVFYGREGMKEVGIR